MLLPTGSKSFYIVCGAMEGIKKSFIPTQNTVIVNTSRNEHQIAQDAPYNMHERDHSYIGLPIFKVTRSEKCQKVLKHSKEL